MRRNDYLKYIDYTFTQSDDVFRINTDTAVLGMFMDDLHGKTVLDIGTGSGALLLYAHYHRAGHLIGADIQKKALELADLNIGRYTSDYELHNCAVQDLRIDPVDVVVCNPPFYEVGNQRKSDSWNRAMFEETMSLDDMFKAIRRNLKDNGESYVLYPAERFPEFYDACIRYRMKIMKIRFVHDEKRPYASRFTVRMKIGPMKKLKVLKPLFINGGNFEYE